MPQIPPINLPLEHAIDTASINRLRIALRHVRNHVSTTDRELQRILLVPEKRAKCEIIDLETDSEVDIQQKSGNEDEDGSSIGSEAVEEVESEQGEESEDDRRIGSNGVEDPRTRSWTLQFANATPSPKRFRPRYAECQNCEEEFDVTQNEQKLCRYHPEEREPDYESDFWADHDERCHGRIADLEDEYPEGFMWTCCGRNGEDLGCRKGRHVELHSSRARRRV